MSKNLKDRLVVGAAAIVLLLTLLFFSHNPSIRPVFVLSLTTIIGLALWEYYNIARTKGFQPMVFFGLFGSSFFLLTAFFLHQQPYADLIPPLILMTTLFTMFVWCFFEGSDPFANLAITTFGVIYLVVPLSYLVHINDFFPNQGAQDGRWWLFYLFFTTKITDIGAYISGKVFGKKKLAPYISPQKTWNGSLGGLAFAIAFSVIFYLLAQEGHLRLHLTFAASIFLGIAIGLLAQIGDLAESLLKRDAGVKDSNVLPGLGGMLDMVDSLVFTTPLVYAFLKLSTA